MREPRGLVKENTTLVEALRIASRENLTKVPVLSEDSTVFGYLDLEVVSRKFVDPEGEVREYARRVKRLEVRRDSDAIDALRAFYRFGLGVVPVVEDGKVIGEVRRLDLINSFMAETSDVLARELATNVSKGNVIVVAPEDSLVRARLLMSLNGISAVPVVKGGKLVGAVRLNDLLLELYESHSRGYDDRAINAVLGETGLVREAYTVRPDSTLFDIVSSEGFAVVCRAFLEQDDLKVLTAGDIVRFLVHELGLNEDVVLTGLMNLSPDLSESVRDLARTYAERLKRMIGVDDLIVDLRREKGYSVRIRARTAREEDVETEAFERDPLKALKLAFERLEDKLKNLKEIKTRERNPSKG
jgi:CBS domain-containing protein